jgi:hypothetical protein
MKASSRWLVGAAGVMLAVSGGQSGAISLFSTSETYLGTGKFHGPGSYLEEQVLFPTVIRHMVWTTEKDFVTPFFNNGPAEPNTTGERSFRGPVDGKLSNGWLINENVDIYPSSIAGTPVLFAVVDSGPHNGQQLTVTSDQGEVVMTMDLGLDLGIGAKGVVRLPFYGTTGTLVVPYSLQTQAGGKGIDQAGKFPSGTKLTGRVGDFNHDGWIDGTIVAVGTLPLDSPIYPGQPYVIERYFETDIPIKGAVFGNVKELQQPAANP